jgi:hypothetical protein
MNENKKTRKRSPEEIEQLKTLCAASGKSKKQFAADTLNDKVLPFFEENGIPLLRLLTDCGTEYCGKREYHEFALYLDLEGIEHSKTKVKRPQSN